MKSQIFWEYYYYINIIIVKELIIYQFLYMKMKIMSQYNLVICFLYHLHLIINFYMDYFNQMDKYIFEKIECVNTDATYIYLLLFNTV